MKKLLLSIIIVGILISMVGCTKEVPVVVKSKVIKSNETKNAILLRGCFSQSLKVIPEIKWIKFVDNSVYIGFNPIPVDVSMILAGHALSGWKTINFGCHIYAYDASKYGPTTGGNFFAGATCRYGKLKGY